MVSHCFSMISSRVLFKYVQGFSRILMHSQWVCQAYSHFFVEPLVHVASILGGLLSQEVIKALDGT